jgi:DNA-directed RNA polymerase specialized sigma24 family protein
MYLVVRTWTDRRCEDCDLRHALAESGSPKPHPVYGYSLAYGCDGCGGTGRASFKVKLELQPALESLTSKQRFVIERRLGLVGGRKFTQSEIAESMGVDQTTVRDHESSAKDRLRKLSWY